MRLYGWYVAGSDIPAEAEVYTIRPSVLLSVFLPNLNLEEEFERGSREDGDGDAFPAVAARCALASDGHLPKPHRQGMVKVSRDPRLAEKVADVVRLDLQPPGGAMVLSIDTKTQIQALDRTQPLLPLDFGVTEQRTHDYRRHGITNLFAALEVGSGQVRAECYPERNGANFPAFLHKAVKPHAGKQIHVVLKTCPPTSPPTCGFGIITRQGTFTSVNTLIARIRDYIRHWNIDAERFTWTATTDDPGPSPLGADQHQAARRHRRQVTPSGSRDTRYAPSMRRSANVRRCTH